MRNNTNNGKNWWSTLPSSVKLAIGVMIGIGFLAFFHVANEKHEQTKKFQYEREARERMKRQQLYESLEAERQERIKKAEAYQITDEQRRMIHENLRRQAELDARAEELRDKYNRGEELTNEEKDAIYDYYRDEYYEDPDAEDHYPSEIFDDMEDYDEEHVRDNPGVAGDD